MCLMGEFTEVAKSDELKDGMMRAVSTPDKVKTILCKDWKGEVLLLESPGKNHWRRSSYGRIIFTI
jgi:hypothetical protein